MIEDKSTDEFGNVNDVPNIGVGSYQIWRMKEAYRSITVGGNKVTIKVLDEDNHKIDLPPYITKDV